MKSFSLLSFLLLVFFFFFFFNFHWLLNLLIHREGICLSYRVLQRKNVYSLIVCFLINMVLIFDAGIVL
jgi:hypothetical protein